MACVLPCLPASECFVGVDVWWTLSQRLVKIQQGRMYVEAHPFAWCLAELFADPAPPFERCAVSASGALFRYSICDRSACQPNHPYLSERKGEQWP